MDPGPPDGEDQANEERADAARVLVPELELLGAPEKPTVSGWISCFISAYAPFSRSQRDDRSWLGGMSAGMGARGKGSPRRPTEGASVDHGVGEPGSMLPASNIQHLGRFRARARRTRCAQETFHDAS